MTGRQSAIRLEPREQDFFKRYQPFLFAMVCVLAALPFLRLGDTDLSGDEGMWALRGKAIAERGAWLDQTDYAVKGLYSGAYPPLFFWAMGLSMNAFGVHPAAARLPSAFFGFATVIVIFYIARKTYGFRSAVIAAVVFALGHEYIANAQRAEMDVTYVFWVTLGVYLYMRYQRGSGRALVILPAAGMATGMAFMTKPLLGLYVPFVLIPYLFTMAAFQGYGWKRAVIDLLVLALGAFAVMAFWHGYMLGQHPGPKGFWWWLFERNIRQRAASSMEGHSSGFGPLYYLHVLVNYYPFAFPLAMVGFSETLRALWHKLTYRPHSFPGTPAGAVTRVPLSVDDRMRLLIVFWMVVTLAVPSVMASKLGKYVLPAAVPFAILAGVAIDRVFRGATSQETNVALFAWTVMSVVYWQTHKAHHALEALLGCLWRWEPLGPGEIAILTDGGTVAILRVLGAGIGALTLALLVWSMRNRASVGHETVGRSVFPLILLPMLVIAVVRVAVPPRDDPRDPGPRPLASEAAFSEASRAADDVGLADHVLILGHYRDQFRLAFYTGAVNYPPSRWRPEIEHRCRLEGAANEDARIPALVRFEYDDTDDRWRQIDLGLENRDQPVDDPYETVQALWSSVSQAGESLLLIVVLHDRQLQAERDQVDKLLRDLEASLGRVLYRDPTGRGLALVQLRPR